MTQKRSTSNQEWQTKHEDLLIAIDQLEQLTEIMGEALNRVKQRVAVLENTPHIISSENELRSEPHNLNTTTPAKKKSSVH